MNNNNNLHNNKDQDDEEDYDDDFIKGSLRCHQGDQISGFPSMECFRSLLTPQIAKLK